MIGYERDKMIISHVLVYLCENCDKHTRDMDINLSWLKDPLWVVADCKCTDCGHVQRMTILKEDE